MVSTYRRDGHSFYLLRVVGNHTWLLEKRWPWCVQLQALLEQDYSAFTKKTTKKGFPKIAQADGTVGVSLDPFTLQQGIWALHDFFKAGLKHSFVSASTLFHCCSPLPRQDLLQQLAPVAHTGRRTGSPHALCFALLACLLTY